LLFAYGEDEAQQAVIKMFGADPVNYLSVLFAIPVFTDVFCTTDIGCSALSVPFAILECTDINDIAIFATTGKG